MPGKNGQHGGAQAGLRSSKEATGAGVEGAEEMGFGDAVGGHGVPSQVRPCRPLAGLGFYFIEWK